MNTLTQYRSCALAAAAAAAQHGFAKIVQLLLESSDIEMQSSSSWTIVLMIVALNGQSSVVRLLLTRDDIAIEADMDRHESFDVALYLQRIGHRISSHWTVRFPSHPLRARVLEARVCDAGSCMSSFQAHNTTLCDIKSSPIENRRRDGL